MTVSLRREAGQSVIQGVAPLWSEYTRAVKALLDANVIRSSKRPEADLSEFLIAALVKGQLLRSKSHPSYDVVAGGDTRISVKSINKMPGNLNGYIIGKKDRTNNPKAGEATHYAFVWFDMWIPDAIFIAPEEFVRTWRQRQIHRHDLEPHRIDVDLAPFKIRHAR